MRLRAHLFVILFASIGCSEAPAPKNADPTPDVSTPNPCLTGNGGCDANATCVYTTIVSCTCLAGFTGDGITCTAADSGNPNGKQIAPLEGEACTDKCLEGLSCLGTKTDTFCRVPCDEDASVCSTGTRCADFAGLGYLFVCLPVSPSGAKCDGILTICDKGLGCFDGICATAREAGETCHAPEECVSGALCIAGSDDIGYCRVDCSSSSDACTVDETCEATTDGGAVCMPI